MEGGGVYSYSTKPLSIDLAALLSDRKVPLDIDALIDALRLHDIRHIAYFSTCASAPRYRDMVNMTDVMYSGSHIQILTVPGL